MKLRSAALVVSAAMLFMLPGCSKKKVMPEKFKAMPDTISADEINITDSEPAYKCTKNTYFDGELTEVTETEYDGYGSEVSYHLQTVDSSGYRTFTLYAAAYEYNENNDPVRIVTYDPGSGKITSLTQYSYLPDGDMEHMTKYIASKDADVLKKRLYFEDKYDEHHNCIEDIHAKADEGMVSDYTYRYEYDSSGNISKAVKKDKCRKNYISEESYTYDNEGNMLSKKIHTKTSKKESTVEYLYEYDSHGNCIKETRSSDDPDAHQVKTFEYDSNDRLVHGSDSGYEYEYEYEDY